MELAGVVGMQGSLSPDLLKYVFVKGQETSDQQLGRTTFSVFSQSQSVMVPQAAPLEPPLQQETATPSDIASEVSAGKQTAITDFFSKHTSSQHASDSTRRAPALQAFIKPCPLVEFAEVPAVFEVQSHYDLENHLDLTHPLFEPEGPKFSADILYITNTVFAEPKEVLTESAKQYYRCRSHSQAAPAATWHDRMASSAPSDEKEALVEISTEDSESSFPASPESSKENMGPKGTSSSAETAPTEVTELSQTEDSMDHGSEIEGLKLAHDLELKEMKKKLDEKDQVNKSITVFAEKAAAKLATLLTQRTNAGPDRVAVQQLTKQRDDLLNEVKSSRTKISDLTHSVENIKEELTTATLRKEDTQAALAEAKAETAAAKAETEKMKGDNAVLTELIRTQLETNKTTLNQLETATNKIKALLDGRGNEVFKDQDRIITFLRADNEELEQELHASSSENTSMRESVKVAEKDVAKHGDLVKRYMREVHSCNARILELEDALQSSTGSVTQSVLTEDKEKIMAELTSRVEEVAFLHQMETKYENHVIQMQADLQCMYDSNASLQQEVAKMKEEEELLNVINNGLQLKVVLFESNRLLMSRYNDICNKHAVLNILATEKLTLEKACASMQKANVAFEERHILSGKSEQDLKTLARDLLNRVIRLSHALEFRGAHPFNAAYAAMVDRVHLVAQVDAEGVYADAITAGCEHEFDVEDLFDDGAEEGDEDYQVEDNEEHDGDERSQAIENADELINDNGLLAKSCSGERLVSSSPVVEVEVSTSPAADAEVVQKSSRIWNAKTGSELDQPEAHNMPDLPTIGSTLDIDTLKIFSVREVENTYLDDAEYSNTYENTVDDVDARDDETFESEFGADIEEEAEHVGGGSSFQNQNAAEIDRHDMYGNPESDQGVQDDQQRAAGTPISHSPISKPIFNFSTPAATTGPKVGTDFDLNFGTDSPPSLFASLTTKPEAVKLKGSIPKGENGPSTSLHHPQQHSLRQEISTAFQVASEAQEEVDQGTEKVAPIPTQLSDFNFGAINGRFDFTGSSEPFSAHATHPAPSGMFTFNAQDPPSVPVQADEQVAEDGVVKGDDTKEDTSKTEAQNEKVRDEEKHVGEKAPGEELSSKEETRLDELHDDDAAKNSSSQGTNLGERIQKEESSTNAQTPDPSSTPSPPSRNAKRAAEKAAKKAAKKAETEARSAKARESKRVRDAMMMR